MKVDQRFSGLKSITWDLFIETGLISLYFIGISNHENQPPHVRTHQRFNGAPQEVTCFGLIQQQVLMAPHLFSKAAESSGKDSFRGIQAPWWIYGQKREEFCCFRKSTTLTSGKGWGRWVFGGFWKDGQMVTFFWEVENDPPTYGCFLKWWYPQIIHFNKVFHYKPSILGAHPYFRKPPWNSLPKTARVLWVYGEGNQSYLVLAGILNYPHPGTQ